MNGPLTLLDFHSDDAFLRVLSSYIHGVLNGSLLIDGARLSSRIILDSVGFDMLHYSSGTTNRAIWSKIAYYLRIG